LKPIPQLERDLRTALNPPGWKPGVSLLIPIPQTFQKTFPGPPMPDN